MSNHRPVIVDHGALLEPRCSCGRRGELGSRGDANVWFFGHQQEIERIRAQLGGRSPSLTNQRDWFRCQAEDAANSPEDRSLWRRLAEEIDAFVVARSAPSVNQLSLF